MIGPVERVPLTDEQLDRLTYMAKHPERWRQSLSNAAPALIAELRASREQELQQRISKALEQCALMETAASFKSVKVASQYIRAALTGTEQANG